MKTVSIKLILLCLVVVSVSACSLEASIQSLDSSATEVFSKPSSAEVTPGSSQNAHSARGFQVQASVSYQDSVSEATTARGMKVYTNVQGTIFKE